LVLIHTYVSVDTIVLWIRLCTRGLIKLAFKIGFPQGRSQIMKIASRPRHPFHVYAMSSEEDYFYRRPNSVLLGFLGAVAIVLLFVMCAFWIGYKIG